jgi:hypothetical protein
MADFFNNRGRASTAAAAAAASSANGASAKDVAKSQPWVEK